MLAGRELWVYRLQFIEGSLLSRRVNQAAQENEHWLPVEPSDGVHFERSRQRCGVCGIDLIQIVISVALRGRARQLLLQEHRPHLVFPDESEEPSPLGDGERVWDEASHAAILPVPAQKRMSTEVT